MINLQRMPKVELKNLVNRLQHEFLNKQQFSITSLKIAVCRYTQPYQTH